MPEFFFKKEKKVFGFCPWMSVSTPEAKLWKSFQSSLSSFGVLAVVNVLKTWFFFFVTDAAAK